VTLILVGALLSATPLTLAALGELIAETSGVMNLGVEGMMLLGAISGFLTVFATGNLLFGVLVAMVASSLLALVHAVLTITLRADQIVSGLAVTLFGIGLSQFLGQPVAGKQVTTVFTPLPVPGVADVPWLGAAFNQNLLTYVTYVLIAVTWIFLRYLRPGLALRAVGENPDAADAAGVDVFRARYLAVLVGGALAGLAGAFVSLAYITSWTQGITAGRGWIALAVVVFARWTPPGVAAGGFLFGLAYVLAFATQTVQSIAQIIPTYFVQMLPYLLAIGVLVFVSSRARGRSAAPGALALPFVRGQR
jgi:simple sugar transport system permease protein